MWFSELLNQRVISVEGSLYDVGKIAQKKQQHERIFLGVGRSPVYVHRIAYAHESIVGNSQRHEKLDWGKDAVVTPYAADAVDDVAEEIKIFGPQQHQQSEQDGYEYYDFFSAVCFLF